MLAFIRSLIIPDPIKRAAMDLNTARIELLMSLEAKEDAVARCDKLVKRVARLEETVKRNGGQI